MGALALSLGELLSGWTLGAAAPVLFGLAGIFCWPLL
jgi:hypothetical protein